MYTIIFKTIGTHSPEAYNLREIESPAPPFQCCVTIFILFQAPTVSAYNTTTLIGEGAGEGRNVTAKLYLPDNYTQTVGVPISFETDCSLLLFYVPPPLKMGALLALWAPLTMNSE